MTIELCAEKVKVNDYGRYLTTLFAPRKMRDSLWVLYALNFELAHVRTVVVKEKMMGLIRLQWWHDAIAELYAGQVLNHDVLHALAQVIKNNSVWTEDDFHRLIESYQQDFQNDDASAKAVLERQIEQNKIVLQIALQLHSHNVPDDVIGMVAAHYTTAKSILRNEFYPADLQEYVMKSLVELNAISHKAIRQAPALLIADVARYDYLAIQKSGYEPARIVPEIHRSLMGFYLWRKNPLLAIASL